MQGAFDANENTLKELIGAGAAAAALMNTNELLARQDGSILNPNMELLFNSPQLEVLDFLLNFHQEVAQKERILEIIRYFKQAMVPKKTQESFFLKSPNTFKVEYVHKGKGNHPGLNKYKECALVQCQVNYTPEGTYNTFIDGVMHSYEMTLQFRELILSLILIMMLLMIRRWVIVVPLHHSERTLQRMLHYKTTLSSGIGY